MPFKKDNPHFMRGKNFTYYVRLNSSKPTTEKLCASNHTAEEDLNFLKGLMSAFSPCTVSKFTHADNSINANMAQRLYNKIEGLIKKHQYDPEVLDKINKLNEFRDFISETKKAKPVSDSLHSRSNRQHRTEGTILPSLHQSNSRIKELPVKLLSVIDARQQFEATVKQRNAQVEKGIAKDCNSLKRKALPARVIDQPPLKKAGEEEKARSAQSSHNNETIEYQNTPFIHLEHPALGKQLGFFKPPHMPRTSDNVTENCEKDLLRLIGIDTNGFS